MSRVKLFTDASSFFPIDLAKKENVVLLESLLMIDGKHYREISDLNRVDFINSLESLDPYPTSTQVPASDVLKELNKAIEEGYDEILYLVVSTNLSNAMNSMNIASKKVKDKIKVTIYQTDYTCTAQGAMTYRAWTMLKDGKSIEEIIKVLDYMKKNTYSIGVSGSFFALFRTGKVKKGAAISILSSALKMKPLAEINTTDGVIGVGAGLGYKNAIKKMVKHIKENTDSNKTYDLFLSDALNKELLKQYEAAIMKNRKIEKSYHWDLTAVVALTIGKGSVMMAITPSEKELEKL